MCQVSTFCCGCADLRKGALIIGSVCLVGTMMMMMMMMISYPQAFALIQVAYTGFLLVALHQLPDVKFFPSSCHLLIFWSTYVILWSFDLHLFIYLCHLLIYTCHHRPNPDNHKYRDHLSLIINGFYHPRVRSRESPLIMYSVRPSHILQTIINFFRGRLNKRFSELWIHCCKND